MTKVFIDGSAGTTGLKIHERLSTRTDITLLEIPPELRKDSKARAEIINAADVAFFCLPDDAAVEAAAMVAGDTVVIDTSTAHRTAPGWVYGFPELGKREQIAAARRIANPGCHASGFLALVAPLVGGGLLAHDAQLSCFSLTGYSGGGNKMIARYEAAGRDASLAAPRQYALAQQHKHLREMIAISGLTQPPAFCPVVADFYSGMAVTVTLHKSQLRGGIGEVEALYRQQYKSPILHCGAPTDPDGMLAANALSGRDDMVITVAGSEERILLVATFDNLGKGACGAAIQNMNIVLGLPEETGLVV